MICKTLTLVIVGAGVTGIACALAAARKNIPVVLLEKSDRLGGTVTGALIHTLGGFFDDGGEVLNPGLSEELIERLYEASPYTRKRRMGKTWVLNADPAIFKQVVGRWLDDSPTVKVCYRSTIHQLSVNARNIDEVTVIDDGLSRKIPTRAVIDATGRADIVRMIDMRLVTEGTALAGWIVRLGGVSPGTLDFPKGLALLRQIRKASEIHELPPECAALWLDSGVYPEEMYVKFNVLAKKHEPAHMMGVANRLLAFLQACPGFSKAVISAQGNLGIRDEGCVRGDYMLTGGDLERGRHFDDAVCRASWPIEYWHPEHGVSLEYLPPGSHYEIPLRALKIGGLGNLFVAGKCFSAEPRAQASARVAGTCWAMGEGLVNAHFGKS